MTHVNRLLSESTLPHHLPPYADLTDDDYREAVVEGMAAHLRELDAIATDTSPATVTTVLEAFDRSGRLLARSADAFYPAVAAHATPRRDEIRAELAPLLAAHQDAVLLDRRLYDRFVALRDRVDAGEVELDDESAWLLSETLKDFERGGIALDPDGQARLREINAEIATLTTEFTELAVAGRNAAAVLVTDREQLAGLPEEDVERARAAAQERGKQGWLLELVNTTGQPLLAELHDRSLRRRVFEASVARGQGGEHDTREIVIRLAQLRAERATLLGHPHPAAQAAAEGCAGSTEAVMAVLTRVGPAAVRNARAEAQVLQQRLEQLEPGATLEPWDWQYLANLVRGERYSLDEGLLRPYLEFERVLHEGVFAAATALYGITFQHRPDLVGYTEEARVYEVLEEDGSVLGAVVLDPWTRSTKQGGAWMTSLVDQSRLLGTLPVVTNTCNLPRPAPGRPTLMSWDNVITLFHEFGHDLHGLMSDVRYVSRSGTSTPQDFVEYPSQVNEMWAWEPALLARYAVHHETGEPMPDEWVRTLLEAREFNQGYEMTESYAGMLLDQVWHQTPAAELPNEPGQVADFEASALQRTGMAFPLVPPRYRSTYFSHIFGGGYAASYYSYMWSEVFDADTVAWFGEQGGLGRETGERFRRQLLARGGSRDVREVYREFRGADPDVRHLLERHRLLDEGEDVGAAPGAR
ncbi:M3 family metallopeptidase [Arsenicicoccus sp. oral taxon 190]|uniref:M3 family metallopeptidase n=1 Tax=Arsenicicoccus sp. oral taxon 190 TaxID=1658671 RepID=UPI000679ED9E|nr:M3 family metallopeptidase [Arsenicicoccus sp. oral taxon 190]AKT51997.1 peptidase M3 [Arsenicicoccus sp. oral taxon 190]